MIKSYSQRYENRCGKLAWLMTKIQFGSIRILINTGF